MRDRFLSCGLLQDFLHIHLYYATLWNHQPLWCVPYDIHIILDIIEVILHIVAHGTHSVTLFPLTREFTFGFYPPYGV